MEDHGEVQWMQLTLRVSAFIILCIAIRLLLLISIARPAIKPRKPSDKCRIAIFLGSGGHTSEMMQLVQALPIERYVSRTYIMTTSDRFSMGKALEFEKTISADAAIGSAPSSSFNFIQLPRARSVHQKWLSTPLSVLLAFGASTYHLILRPMFSKSENSSIPHAILMNGPGTCVPIVASIYLLRFFGLESPRLIYVESFARVSSLSLTAKILRHLVDRFVVQWHQAITRGSDYRGYLV